MERRFFVHNPEIYKEMISLLRSGHSASSIARKFGVDHTTILYHKKKLIGVSDIIVKKSTTVIFHTPPPKQKYEDLIFERKNQGHDYAWYLRKEREKMQKSRIDNARGLA